jgi:hypothetical protein
MNSDEVNNLLSVMQKKISELTTQNIMLEAKVIHLNNILASIQKDSENKEVQNSDFTESA